jgi:5-methylcytosine-specific restriction protein A
MNRTQMQKLLFLNVGWMSKYQGLNRDTITGGGAYISSHGFGHELLNFKPFRGRMYGFGRVPHSSIKIEKLGAQPGALAADGVLVIWVAASRIVGWYNNATVFRRVQAPPKGSARFYQGDPMGYNIMANACDCQLLLPDARLFEVPRSRERADAMGRYLWYAKGPKNDLYRKEVLAYISCGGIQPKTPKATFATSGGVCQPNFKKRQEVEQAAIDLAAAYFEDLGYDVDSVDSGGRQCWVGSSGSSSAFW